MNDDKENPLHIKCPTYGGLDRSVLFFGIPLMPLVLTIIITMLFSIIAINTIGLWGLSVLIIPIPVLSFLKTITRTDDKAIEVIWYEIRCLLRRRNAKMYGHTLTIQGLKYGEKLDDYQRFFEPSRTQAVGTFGLDAKIIKARNE